MQNINYEDDNFNNIINLLLNVKNEEDDICLITKEKLYEPIKLECGHTFNYNAILIEIKKQKYIKYSLDTQKLKNNEIKCPYCRNIQKFLLPYFVNYPKYNNVNYPINLTYRPNKCIYKFKYGKNKDNNCGVKCYDKYCIKHTKMLNNKNKKEKEIEKGQNITITKTIYLDKVYKNSDNYHKFYCTCEYVYKKGKNKGNTCNKRILSDSNGIHNRKCGIPVYYDKNLCSKHLIGKQKIIKPKYIPYNIFKCPVSMHINEFKKIMNNYRLKMKENNEYICKKRPLHGYFLK